MISFRTDVRHFYNLHWQNPNKTDLIYNIKTCSRGFQKGATSAHVFDAKIMTLKFAVTNLPLDFRCLPAGLDLNLTCLSIMLPCSAGNFRVQSDFILLVFF